MTIDGPIQSFRKMKKNGFIDGEILENKQIALLFYKIEFNVLFLASSNKQLNSFERKRISRILSYS